MMTEFQGPTNLIAELDKKLMVLLRDGKTLIGILRSIDQFANLVLHRTIERIYVGDKYGDIARGIFIVRGENVALCGEIDESQPDDKNSNLQEVPVEEILELQQKELERLEEKRKIKQIALSKYGFFLSNDQNCFDLE